MSNATVFATEPVLAHREESVIISRDVPVLYMYHVLKIKYIDTNNVSIP